LDSRRLALWWRPRLRARQAYVHIAFHFGLAVSNRLAHKDGLWAKPEPLVDLPDTRNGPMRVPASECGVCLRWFYCWEGIALGRVAHLLGELDREEVADLAKFAIRGQGFNVNVRGPQHGAGRGLVHAAALRRAQLEQSARGHEPRLSGTFVGATCRRQALEIFAHSLQRQDKHALGVGAAACIRHSF
jgi:hypothetical protein